MSSSAFDIAASGMAAHRAEMDVITQNIAHAGTGRPDGSSPYRAKTAVFEPVEQANDYTFADALDSAFGAGSAGVGWEDSGSGGVRFAGVMESDGPDIDPIEQMVALVSAGRAYDADVAALQAAKQMDVEAIDVERT